MKTLPGSEPMGQERVFKAGEGADSGMRCQCVYPPTRIPTTPAMERFNAALEDADRALDYHLDRILDPCRVAHALYMRGDYPTAGRLEDAWEALKSENKS